ncbi:MAG TPA: phospholipase D-like domain-containing protein [Candidatus Hydrogenedentes bacterium]|nr:phospholipase D-like domain-containing protein [Candidatus Hydrogenedentota bacterium]
MPHDIIDNRKEKLVEHINQILGTTESAKFAVGYFFLSGLEAIQENLAKVKQLRLLIGNTSSKETIEQISEGYKRLELVQTAEEKERYLKRTEKKHRADETAGNLRQTIAMMDQTDGGESLVRTLIQLIEEKRLDVRVYTKGRLHAKAYIFDYPSEGHYETGIAVIGSSNLTLSGLTHNTELNVVVHGNENHARLTEWFDGLWEESDPFEAHLMDELKASWAAARVTPYDIYMKSLYALVSDRLEEKEGGEILWDDEVTRSLAEFQKVAVRQAIQMIRDHGGAFVSDVVGLGKSYIGAGIVKHFARTERARPLIVCPKPLEDMWENYNEIFELNARVLPMSLLRYTGKGGLQSILEEQKYRDRNFVLIDESHHFRHHSSQRYEVMETYLARGDKKVCLLTATPRNQDARDVYNQIKLFHPDDITHLPIDPPNLKEYFRQIDKGERRLQDLLVHILIRRTRKHILRYYGYTEDANRPMRELSNGQAKQYLDGGKRAYVLVAGRHQYFPQRELETLRYSVEETYKGLYDQIRQYLGRPAGKRYTPNPNEELTYARYGLWRYVRAEKQKAKPYGDLQRAGVNLRGLIRVMLFKRFESSVYAFRETLKRLEKIHEYFLQAIDEGFVPAGEDAQKLLYESDALDETGLMDSLRESSGRYDIRDFDAERLREHLEADRKLLAKMVGLVAPITPDKDAKLQTFLAKLDKSIRKKRGKVLVFTQYADTARYVYENLNGDGSRKDVESIYGTDKSKARMAARFAPLANPHINVGDEQEVNTLVATDVMSEGLNLQDGDVIVNYDLHWNPVRLIQRFGRIDRIGSENDVVWGFNFLPETSLEKNLGLRAVLAKRIQEIHDTIGEDAAILDESEKLNEDAMFAIYEKKGQQLSMFEDESGDFVDINEAEEMLRSLKKEDPAEFERIANLRDGIRSARHVFSGRGNYVFCQAARYRQLFLTDEDGGVVSRDVPAVLGRIKCSKDEPAAVIPPGYNRQIGKVMEIFATEVKHRRAQQKHSLSLTVGQTYVLRELRAFYTSLEDGDEDLRTQIAILEEAFKHPVTAAIRNELNRVRRNGITGPNLLKTLSDIFHDHGMKDRETSNRREMAEEADEVPRIICSEAML